MQYRQCLVSLPSSEKNTLLRSLPSENAQAVGSISQGDKAYISDQKGSWVFIQGVGEFEGKSYNTDGGWILSNYLSNCHNTY